MSWDSYIDNLIAQSKDDAGTAHIDKGCIIGLDGGGAWTTSDPANALGLVGEEASKIASIMKLDPAKFQATGIFIGGVKYMFLRAENGNLALAKKKDHGAITIQKSKSAIVIAHCPEGCQHGNTNKAVSIIADYLESLGM